ncbi:hypothetical protein ACIQH6_24425 [Micromonospora orduensis]|uniref:hypothetical protein n=1 Tax=Micromonospora orduensis TaxID=1420891 RepID=UPI00382E14E8
MEDKQVISEIHVERYRYILQQLNAANENVHRFLAIYQSLATGIFGAGLALFVGYRNWGVNVAIAHKGLIGLGCLLTLVAAFTVLLVISSVFSWLDYRKEECALTNELVGPGFRSPPRIRNFVRWHETYILGFISASTIAVWVLVYSFAIPNMR